MTHRDVWTIVGRLVLVLGLALSGACGKDEGDDEGGAGSGGSSKSDAGDGKAGTDGGVGQVKDGAVFMPETDAATPEVDASRGGTATVPEGCDEPAPNQPPETLYCTGLYADIKKKELNDGVTEFSPAVPLWSDGAEKTRWVYLPPGEKIDVSNPDAWVFPVGTKFWKEFKWEGQRVETRMFWKVSKFYWARTAYKWNADETEATRSGGEDVKIGDTTYRIPSTTQCDQCHKGRQERVLGFEAVLLGLPGAKGVTVASLKADDRLDGTLPSKIELGDDGTGKGADALGWLHVNCGVSCHNGNTASEAYKTKLRFLLKVADADGSDTSDVDAHTTAVNIDAITGRWLGTKRIAPGAPTDSLVFELMSKRDPVNMKDQMPPIASTVVPVDAAKLIKDWIAAMK